MTELNNRIEDILSLVEHNFQFLHVGKFFDEYAKRNDIASEAKSLQVSFIDGKTYRLADNRISEALHSYFVTPNKPTIFGYLVEWNAFRGIGMAMLEGLKDAPLFSDFVKKFLGNRYEHFYHILSFIRNVLSHNIHSEIQLKKDNYEITRNQFKKIDPSGIAKFSIKYADDFPEANSPRDYGFKIEVDFQSLSPGNRFIEVISEWHLYMFSELCFNLVATFRKQLSVTGSGLAITHPA